MTPNEIMLSAAAEHVELTEGFATTLREEIEEGDRDPDDEVFARALESCARMIRGMAARVVVEDS